MLRTLRWLMCVVLLVVSARVLCGETVAGLPAPAGYVNDFAGVLTPETVESLDNLCAQVDHKANAQIAVVTVKSMDADASGAAPSIEEFATALEDKWGVGPKKSDRGVLLIVSLNPRKYRIEVGYGLEGLLNDAKAGDIGRDMQPYLHTGDYNQGIAVATRELAQDIAADKGVTLDQSAPVVPQYAADGSQQPGQMNLLEVLLIGGILVAVIGVLIATGHVGLLFFLLFNILSGGRGGGGFGGGGGFEGGGGGGFGGFGGGGSGGGGASGDF